MAPVALSAKVSHSCLAAKVVVVQERRGQGTKSRNITHSPPRLESTRKGEGGEALKRGIIET